MSGDATQTNAVWYQIGKWGMIAIVVAYLLTEHLQHVILYLPYLFLLSCPLMHFFMHGKHGHHHQHAENKEHVQ